MYDGMTATKLGRVQVAEPMAMDAMVVHDGSPLKEVSWDLATPTLDQEDLFSKQGIDVSKLIPGARKVDALGSCTCNTGTAHLAERWVAAGKDLAAITLKDGSITEGLSSTDAVQDEKFAIVLYNAVTDQTGDPSTSWPPTDCGSSGLYVAQELIRQGLATSYKSGSGVLGALAMLQTGTLMQGSPWFNSWFQIDSKGFVDGDGSKEALDAAIQSGVAGGHETTQHAIVQLAQTKAGHVELNKTVIRVRNSWSKGWGPLGGDYLIHASTLNYLAQYVDYKAVVVA